jgi:hypothetical protein
MIKLNEIGENAGRVWRTLESMGEVPVHVLFEQMEMTHEDLLMAIGWLAREDKVEITEVNGIEVIRLPKFYM